MSTPEHLMITNLAGFDTPNASRLVQIVYLGGSLLAL